MYISENCNWTPYGTDPELDKQVDSDDINIRYKVAEQGYGLDKLVYDKEFSIRFELAKHGYGLDKFVYDKESWIRWEVAKHGYGLDILVNDEDYDVRKEVAKQGYGLDKLVYDKESHIRAEVARHGYRLDILVNDEDRVVRASVAYKGYGLDILVNDKNYHVRKAVAAQGYSLDTLINDEVNWVRVEVARYGYGLDKLINDKDYYVQASVEEYLEDHKLTLSQWMEQNPDKCALGVEDAVKDFIYKISESNKLNVQSYYDSIDEFFSLEIDDDIKMNTIIICAVDTKIPLFKVEKLKSDNQINYKFIIDIMTDKGEHFNVESFIQSQTQLTKFIQQIADTLNLYEQFSKYADDLENCL